MAHNIDMTSGRANFAFTGPREAVWHGLGSELSPGAPLDVWRKEAGMDWKVEESDITYEDRHSSEQGLIHRCFDGRKALYRSDNGAPLSIMASDYKVVQPAEVLEFFRDLTEEHGMVLSTAGCLFKGARFWALAETGQTAEPIKGDVTKGYLLFVTSVDGSVSNTVKFVSTRVVCNNTMVVALQEKNESTKKGGNGVVRQTHRKVFDPFRVKLDLGVFLDSWDAFSYNLKALAERQMTDAQVEQFFKRTLFDPAKEEEKQSAREVKGVTNLMALYKGGAGSEFDYGTALGAFNAVTNLFTHGTGRQRNHDRKFWSAYFDNGVKVKAFESLLETC